MATVRRWSFQVEQPKQLLGTTGKGREPVFDEATRLKAIAFYCQKPLPGCSRWSLSWATVYLNKKLEILGRAISRSTLHRILRGHCLRPHLVRYFLYISDPDFFQKMDHLVNLYMNPPEHLYCLDECSGIQALERVAPAIVTSDGTRIESEYKRHGTRDFIGILEVATGKMFGRCTANHLKETVADVFAQHVRQRPDDAILHYVVDNLAAHSTEIFCHTVADLSGVERPQLKTAPERRRWLQSEDKRIVLHFTPLHGSWLNMVEIWFSILHDKCLRGKSFGSVDALSEAILSFLDTWDEHFAHPFRWTYDGQDLGEKVVRRLCNWILLEAKVSNEKFLLKQLQLMVNLARDYWKRAPRNQWRQLLAVLDQKKEFLDSCIADSGKSRAALAQLRQLLLEKLTLPAPGDTPASNAAPRQAS